jgi:hypothetical protein
VAADAKEEAERDVFLRFAAFQGESVSWASVESRPPPEPDLLCQHVVLGPIAFELVSITDPKIAQIHAGHNPGGQSSYLTSDPTERIIRKKLGCSYTSAHRVELLVYNDQLVVTPDDAMVETVRKWLDAKDHPFQKAWFMGEHAAREIWSRP